MTRLRLITIPMSHYCEKARWALTYCGLDFVEEAHLQMIHWRSAKRAGGGRTVPVLVTPQGVLGESSEIVSYASQHRP
jgi:glutathione S-transferase